MAEEPKPGDVYTVTSPRDALSWHEAQDRAFVSMDTFNSYVREHPVIEGHPALSAVAEQISDLMYDLYQAVSLHDPNVAGEEEGVKTDG